MVVRLREFIAQIRACKTAADERAVVAKEAASIRTMLKEEAPAHRHNNVAKLLYIHMLGYPAQFGQIECVKLVASPRYSDKRIGYLGIMLLLDESQETLTLVTNSLKLDLNHANMFYVSLALCTAGNIASAEMSRDLCPEIETLLTSSNAYLRKKASLCALKIIQKTPELRENFVSRCRGAIIDRNSGPMLTNLALLAELCKHPPTLLSFKSMIPDIVRLLKQLITAGFSPEHDVSGITDPFMQVRLLRVLRILGAGDAAAGELMNDVLAQVATNTDSSKNVGNAILYEAVLAILDVPCEQTLRVLAINILGKFLSNRDNNIRYVALQTLLRTIHMDAATLQRHRATVLDCLRDSDISIRRRALELAFALTNASNVRAMTRELLAFLEVADLEFRPTIAMRVCACAETYAPNPRWHLDTVLRVMKLAGKFLQEDVIAQFVCLASNTPSLHAYATLRLFWLLEHDTSQEGLVHAGVWLIGEYADVLVNANSVSSSVNKGNIAANVSGLAAAGTQNNYLDANDGENDKDAADETVGQPLPTEDSVLALMKRLLETPSISLRSKHYVLTALMKISTRFSSPSVLQRIKDIFLEYSTDSNIEIQQRAVQYHCMSELDPAVKKSLWEQMPPIELKDPMKYQRNAAAAIVSDTAPKATANKSDLNVLLDLDGLNLGDKGGSSSRQPQTQSQFAQPGGATSVKSPLDVMAEIFASAPPPPSQPPLSASNAEYGKEYPAYSSAELNIGLTPTSESGGSEVAVVARFTTTRNTVDNLQLLVAVPKSMQIQMFPIGSGYLAPGQETAQRLVIKNPEKRQIKLRLKVNYRVDLARTVDQIVEFKFPPSVI